MYIYIDIYALVFCLSAPCPVAPSSFVPGSPCSLSICSSNKGSLKGVKTSGMFFLPKIFLRKQNNSYDVAYLCQQERRASIGGGHLFAEDYTKFSHAEGSNAFNKYLNGTSDKLLVECEKKPKKKDIYSHWTLYLAGGDFRRWDRCLLVSFG